MYNNAYPVVVILQPVSKNNEIFLLGVKRNIPPFKDTINLPSGYQECETYQEAAVREFYEETGINIAYGRDIEDIFDKQVTIHTIFNNDNKAINLMFLESKIKINSSTIDFNFSNKETNGLFLIDKHTEIGFPLHKKMIDEYLNQYNNL